MSVRAIHECSNCEKKGSPERRNYPYAESGLSNVILQGVEVADCASCGNSDVIIPNLARIHHAIARALVMSPARLTGEQLRFLRKHLGLTGDELGRYLHTDRTKISKWEREEDRIGPATDRLVRLVAAGLDSELRCEIAAVTEHLPQISDVSGKTRELHVDVATLQSTFLAISKAA